MQLHFPVVGRNTFGSSKLAALNTSYSTDFSATQLYQKKLVIVCFLIRCLVLRSFARNMDYTSIAKLVRTFNVANRIVATLAACDLGKLNFKFLCCGRENI